MNTKSASSAPRRNPGGRPRKFKETSHPITITLPDRMLNLLDAAGPDRARALAGAVDHVYGGPQREHPSVEVLEVAKGVGIIVVGPSIRLRKIPKLRLVEVGPFRYLLTLLGGLVAADLEVILADILHEEERLDPGERSLIAALHQQLRNLRRNEQVSRAEILFVSI